ncbi:MAG TPA: cytochrome c family protein [Rhodobacteraceae bacterium]|jgi:cytochrome c|nr:cytochrome c family protein [Paracoccaceae bacterium]
MFDTMTVTKVGGALCGALLVFLLVKWAGDTIYSTEAGHGDHAGAAYVIEVEAAETEAHDTETVSIATLLASADIGKGEKTFGKCKACHKIESGVNATGPSLFGIVGRNVGTAAGFGYSAGMTEHGGTWTPENLDQFLTNPKAFVPGTKMSFAGLKKIEDRADLIAYLQSVAN